MKILICDDSMTVRKKLANLLNTIQPCIVSEATNGNEAIDFFKKEKPDLVFMDIMMPEKDGLEAVAEIMSSAPHAKIIMLSSVGTKGNLQKALKFGAIDFLQKPVEIEQLKSIFDTLNKEA